MQRPLTELFVEVTDRCLLSCQHCSTEALPDGRREIPLNVLERLLDEGIPLGLKHLFISGGEPFLHSDILPLIGYAKEKGLSVSIYSSGVVQNEGKISSLSVGLTSWLRRQGIDRLIFSVHGLESTHDRITGLSGSFSTVLTSIRNALMSGICVEVHYVPMSVNIQDIPRLIELASELGVHRVSFLRFVPQGRCAQRLELLLDRTQLDQVVRWKYAYEERYPHMYIRLGAPFNCVHPGVQCSAGENKLLISPDGEVFPCEAFKFLRGTRNTIYDLPLVDLWNKDTLLEKLRVLKKQGFPDGCGGCPRLRVCGGGCPGQRMLFYGDMANSKDPLCQAHNGGHAHVQ